MHNDLASERRPPVSTPRDWRRIILVVLAGTLILYFGGSWMYRTFIMSDEDKIRAAIAGAAQGAVDRSPSDVSVILSKDFRLSPLVDKDAVHRALVYILMQQFTGGVSVTLSPDPIPVKLDPKNKGLAYATFRAEVKGKTHPDSDWEPIHNRQGGTEYNATFKNTKDGWKMITVVIKP